MKNSVWLRTSLIIAFCSAVGITSCSIALADQTGPVERVAESKEPVDFERHVAPLLGRLGCNAAACHGAFGGKGDFQMSLFGYSPEMDFDAISDRVDSDDPTESLFLLKPSGGEAHEGGLKFATKSATYRTVENWIQNGANWTPGSGQVKTLKVTPSQITFKPFETQLIAHPVQVKVVAQFVDGTEQDVTHLAQFSSRDEGLINVTSNGVVKPTGPGATSVTISYSNEFASVETIVPLTHTGGFTLVSHNEIDEFVNQRLRRLNMVASPLSTDEEFLRRVTLDTIGRIPTPKEVQNFCSDRATDKREKRIDQLLADPKHASLWANRMCEITKARVADFSGDNSLNIKRSQWWHRWFQKRFAENMPYDKLVRNILTATSRGEQNVKDWIEERADLIRQPLSESKYVYANRAGLDLYWRRPESVESGYPVRDVAELTAAAFIGIRINCARCHKHPFDRWSQDDYASFANVFSNVAFGSSTELSVAIFDDFDRQREAKRLGKPIRKLPQLQEVYNSQEWGKRIPGSSKEANVDPRPLGGSRLNTEVDLRNQFAAWLTATDNQQFARSFSNRVWDVYFGVGLVDPVDDFSVANTPSHPRLLDWLGTDFASGDFDIRKLEKTVLMSAAYQRTSKPVTGNQADRRNFARQYVRPLTAEVLLDSLNQSLGTSDQFTGLPQGSFAIEIGGDNVGGSAAKFFKTFGKSTRESVCDCDRRTEPDMRQSLFLMVDSFVLDKIANGEIRELLAENDKTLVERVYLRMLARHPTDEEIEIGLQYFADSKERESAFDDYVWAIMNTREYATNH